MAAAVGALLVSADYFIDGVSRRGLVVAEPVAGRQQFGSGATSGCTSAGRQHERPAG
jgi:hypothetical protein